MVSTSYDLIVVGSGFAGCMTTLGFLEACQKLNKRGRVALVEAGKNGERCGASRWTGAFLRLDQSLNFDEDWIKEMIQVSNNQADLEYCRKLEQEAKTTAKYLQDHGVKLVPQEEKNVSGHSREGVSPQLNWVCRFSSNSKRISALLSPMEEDGCHQGAYETYRTVRQLRHPLAD